ncbi:peroxisomal membrane protein 11-3-like [Lolium perenne]|uniref:peroxisomal membrane protein 11-3-like n=1 Tax=Lolium perenne TaxID=4522 RepID=UPI003A9A4304
MASVSDPRTCKAAAAMHAPPRDFLVHLEAHLARHDGRQAAQDLALAAVGLNRKAFRLGKFVQDVNTLRVGRSPLLPPPLVLHAYGGEGVYYFLEQFVWLAKADLLPAHLLPRLHLRPPRSSRGEELLPVVAEEQG